MLVDRKTLARNSDFTRQHTTSTRLLVLIQWLAKIFRHFSRPLPNKNGGKNEREPSESFPERRVEEFLRAPKFCERFVSRLFRPFNCKCLEQVIFSVNVRPRIKVLVQILGNFQYSVFYVYTASFPFRGTKLKFLFWKGWELSFKGISSCICSLEAIMNYWLQWNVIQWLF